MCWELVLERAQSHGYNSPVIFYPLKLKPIFKERIWGGTRLATRFAKALPPQTRIGESWELVDLPQDKSIVANGALAGHAIADVVDRYGDGITGRPSFPSPFPVLIKLLDAHDVLSVQVHPDANACRRMGRGDPKTECWYIMDAEPGSTIYRGLAAGVTRKDLKAAIAQGTVADLLIQIPVEPGQCYFLPTGTLHAIGPGLLIAEIQQPSDTTYRLFDWNRVDAEGQGRELHVEASLECIHFDQPADLEVTTQGRLVDCDYFKVDKHQGAGGTQASLAPGVMQIFLFLSGAGRFVQTTSETLDFRGGDCFILPASYEGNVSFSQETEYLAVTL